MEQDKNNQDNKVKLTKGVLCSFGLFAFIFALGSMVDGALGRYTFLGFGLSLVFIGYSLSPKYFLGNLSTHKVMLSSASSYLSIIGFGLVLVGELIHRYGNGL